MTKQFTVGQIVRWGKNEYVVSRAIPEGSGQSLAIVTPDQYPEDVNTQRMWVSNWDVEAV